MIDESQIEYLQNGEIVDADNLNRPLRQLVSATNTTFAPAAHTHPVSQVTGLGNAATRNVGTTSNTIMAGNDSRVVANTSKLSGIATGATKNATDAQLRARSSHTGTQAISTITGLQSSLDSKVDKQSGYGLSQENYTQAEKSKLSSLEGSKFKGEYVSLAALVSSQPSPEVGSYAHVDIGVGEVVSKYIWDSSDAEWVKQQGETASLTSAEVKSLYEGNPDTNAFTDAQKTKLTGIATGATKNRADSANADKAHTHPWDQVTEQPDTATRWPTFAEVSGKPTNYTTTWNSVASKPAQATRWPTWSEVSGKPTITNPLGVGQSWQNMTSSRVVRTAFTNSTGRPIAVSVTVAGISAGVEMRISSQVIGINDILEDNSAGQSCLIIVPAGHTYSAHPLDGTLLTWMELR